MADYFETDTPQALLNAFDAAITLGHQKGGITTWKKIQGFYTHTSNQWGGLAYFKATVGRTGRLTFNILPPKGGSITVTTYGYYHGHLIETFLNHFEEKFSVGSATAHPVAGDRVE